jgi:hypothetical protein
MAVLALIIPLIFGSTFYAGNKDFFDTASKQIEEGYNWQYIGYKKANKEMPSLMIQVDGHDPYVLWKLRKGQ